MMSRPVRRCGSVRNSVCRRRAMHGGGVRGSRMALMRCVPVMHHAMGRCQVGGLSGRRLRGLRRVNSSCARGTRPGQSPCQSKSQNARQLHPEKVLSMRSSAAPSPKRGISANVPRNLMLAEMERRSCAFRPCLPDAPAARPGGTAGALTVLVNPTISENVPHWCNQSAARLQLSFLSGSLSRTTDPIWNKLRGPANPSKISSGAGKRERPGHAPPHRSSPGRATATPRPGAPQPQPPAEPRETPAQNR